MNNNSAVIILGHGTRRKQARESFFALVDKIASRLVQVRVLPACFSCGSPSLMEQARLLAQEGYTHIIIFPYFLLSGKHIADELPCFVDALKSEFPAVSFELLATMEDEPLLEAIVLTRLQRYLPVDGPGEGKKTDLGEWQGRDIISGHFAVTGHSAEHRPFFTAMAQATGDLVMAAEIGVQGEAARAYADAAASGSPILCDSKALGAAVAAMGCETLCIPESVDQTGIFLKKNIPGAVVAVGTKPRIIAQVIDLVKEGGDPPALVIGLPPGFTGAPRAKQRLAGSELVHITNPGTGGGISCVLGMIQVLDAMSRRQVNETM